MSYSEAKVKYAACGVDAEAAIEKLKTVPISLHCWQGDDVRGFDTDPSKPLTGGIQTTGNYPGRARTLAELLTLQALSVALQVEKDWDPVKYVRCHPGGKLGQLRENEK